jgi:hypothetical protein
MLGGGDYVLIRFGDDAAFGVLYGTKNNTNTIIIVAIHTRYIGIADVYDETGAKIGKVPIKVWTIFGQRMEDLFEFNDTNGDGVCNYRKSGDGLRYDDYPLHEPIYKRVSMYTAWERSKIITNTTSKGKTWKFSLTATNLSYKAVGNSPSINDSVKNDKHEKLEFTFHLSAEIIQINNISVPTYRVTVKKEGMKYVIVNSTRTTNTIKSGKRRLYTVKYDYLIEGWDFDKLNTNKSLLLEWHALLGVYIPKKVVEWLKIQYLKKIKGFGQAEIEYKNGIEKIEESDAVSEHKPVKGLPRKLKSRYIKFGDNWQRIGRLTWISNVTVDNVDTHMHAQIQGYKRTILIGAKGNVYAGFAVLGGFSYPGGNSIYHDPTVDGSVTFFDTKPQPRIPIVLTFLSFCVVGVGVSVGAFVYLRASEKKKRMRIREYSELLDSVKDEEKVKEDWKY